MEKNEVKIILLITRFQLKQLMTAPQIYESDGEVRISYPTQIDDRTIKDAVPKATLFPFHTKDLQLESIRFGDRVSRFIRRPLDLFAFYRSVARRNNSFIEKLTAGIDPATPLHIVIFNDRDLLTQLLLKHVKQRKIRVTAVDEGLGYYIKEGLREKTMKIIYKMISPVFFGFDYLFIEQYGTHPMIDEVYLKYPKQLIERKSHVTYKALPYAMPAATVSNQVVRPTLLFFSTLFSEDNYITDAEEKAMYIFVGEAILQHNASFAWKAHPRENEQKIKNLEAVLRSILGDRFYRIDNSTDIESLDIFSFDGVVNFGSTVMLFILEAGFPPRNVINLRMNKLELQTKSEVVTLPFSRYKSAISQLLAKMTINTAS